MFIGRCEVRDLNLPANIHYCAKMFYYSVCIILVLDGLDWPDHSKLYYHIGGEYVYIFW